MSLPNKWRAVHFSDGLAGSKWEREIVPKFERDYANANKTERHGTLQL